MTIKGWVSSDGMSNGMEINDKTEVRRKSSKPSPFQY
jgi:hypothetical protein